MATIVDRASMTTATTGTGTITLGSAVPSFQTFAAAGVVNGDAGIEYLIEEGLTWEIGTGTYSSTGPTLTRVLRSSSTGSLLNLGGGAIVSILPTALTISSLAPKASPTFTGTITAAIANFSGAISALTLNTGQGANELYAMNQNVRSSNSPTFAALTLTAPLDEIYGGTGIASYAVGDLLYASTTTVLSKLADVATGNVLISGGVNTAPSWGKVGLTTHISGVLPVANGGTNLSSGTSGGILGYTAAGTLASSVALTQFAIVIGGGAGNTPTPLGSLGTTSTVLHGNVSGPPTWGAVSLVTDVTGTLPAVNGGTGQNLYVIGDILAASSTTGLSPIADVATGNALISGGIGAFPFWGKIGLTTHVSGILPVANGGTNLSSGTSGGILGFTASGVIASSVALTQNALILGGGAGATPAPMGSLGTTTTVLHGNAAGAPTWGAVSLTADVSGILPGANGGTGQSSYAVGDILYASGASTLSKLADVATGNALISGGVTTAPAWGKIGLTTHISGILPVANGGTNLASGTSGGILGYTATGVIASSVALTANAIVLGGGAGATPTPLASLGTTTTVLHGNAAGAPTWGAISLTADISGILPVLNGGTGVTTSTGTGSVVLSASPTFTGTITAAIANFSGAITATTLDTGQGANELYAMNQNVRTTDGPTFANLNISGTFPSIQYYESDAGVDQKYFQIYQNTGILAFRFVNDAYALANNWLEVRRVSGSYVTESVQFPNGVVSIGVTPVIGSSSKLWLGGSSSISFAGINTGVFGNLYYTTGWKYSLDGSGGLLLFPGTTTAVSLYYAPVNAGGAGAAVTPVIGLSLSTSGVVDIPGSLTLGTALAAAEGGTGQASYAIGDILYASTTTALSKLADVATGNALISGGVGVAPAWGKIALTTHISGTLPVLNGGTGVTTSTGTGSVVLSASPTLTGTLTAAAANIAGPVAINGTGTVSSLFHIKDTYTSSGNVVIKNDVTLNSSATSSNIGFYNNVTFLPTGASLTSIYGIANNFIVDAATAIDITSILGIATTPTINSGYTNKISSVYNYYSSFNNLSSTFVNTFINYYGLGNANGTGLTTGTVNNYGLLQQNFTGITGVGTGTINNYAAYLVVPTGNPTGGTTNAYGLFITGNGGTAAGGTLNKYAIYSASTADSFLTGALSVGGDLSLSGLSFSHTPKTPVVASTTTPTLSPNVGVGIKIIGSYAYLIAGSGTQGELIVLDVSNATSPIFVTTLAFTAIPRNIVVSGSYAYITTNTTAQTVKVVDISDPYNPTVVNTINAALTADAIVVVGKVLYVGVGTNFRIYDVTNPTTPVQLSTTSIASITNVRAIAIQGKYAYLGINSATIPGIIVYDISDPTAPVLAGSYVSASPVVALQVSGKYAYLGLTAAPALAIADISNPAAIASVSTLATASIMTTASRDTMILSDDYLYFCMANVSGTIQIINVKDPTTPVVAAASVTSIGVNAGVCLYGPVLYCAINAATNNLVAFNISGISTPTADIGALNIGQLNVRDNAYFDRSISINSGINVGVGGIYSRGGIYTTSEIAIPAGQRINFAGDINNPDLEQISSTVSGQLDLFARGNVNIVGDTNNNAAATNSIFSISQGATTVAGATTIFNVQKNGVIGITGSLTLSTPLAAIQGGTGQSVYAVGDLLYASTTTALSKLADVATGNALISGGVGVAPAWGKIALTTHISGVLPVANGGTNISSYAVGDLLYASGTTTLAKLADVATGNVLISGGVTTAPAWGKVGLTTHVSGVLNVANGGTGVSTSTGTGNVVLSASPTFTGTITAAAANFSGAITATTLDTGQGANELYAMNQNVRTTDGVTFSTIDLIGIQPSIKYYESDGGTDQKYFQMYQNSGTLVFRFVNDAYTLGSNWLTVARSSGSYTASTVTFTTASVGIGITPVTNTNSLLWDSGDFTFSGIGQSILGNLYNGGGWRYNINGSGGYVKFTGTTTAIELGYATVNAAGAAAAATLVPALTISTSGVVNIPGSLTIGTSLAVAQGGTGGSTALAALANLVVQYTWAGKPTASGATGQIIQITNVGIGGSLWISDGTEWQPTEPIILARGNTQIGLTGTTSETAMVTFAILAGLLGSNRRIEVRALYSFTGSTNSKSLRCRYGGLPSGSQLFVGVTTTAADVSFTGYGFIANRNATNSQIFSPTPTDGFSSTAIGTSAIDTTTAANLMLTGQLGLGSETINLQSYSVVLTA